MTKYEFEYNYGKKQKQFNKFLNSNQPDLIKQGMRKFFMRISDLILKLKNLNSNYLFTNKKRKTMGLVVYAKN